MRKKEVIIIVLVLVLIVVAALLINSINPEEMKINSSPPLTQEETSCLQFNCNLPSPANYIGSKEKEEYYSCNCPEAQSISQDDRICFTSDQEAIYRSFIKINC